MLSSLLESLGLEQEFFELLLQGLWYTVQTTLISMSLGMVLAVIFVGLQKFPFKPIAWLFEFILICLRGLPEIVMVFLVFYGIGTLFSEFDFELSEFWAGVIALTTIFAAYASQTLRGAIEAIPSSQWESAKAMGLGKITTFFGIIMPQMWRQAIPGLTNQWLSLVKDSSLVSTIGVTEIIYYTNAAIRVTHKPFNWYIVAAVLYLVLTIISNFILRKLEAKANYYIPIDKTSKSSIW